MTLPPRLVGLTSRVFFFGLVWHRVGCPPRSSGIETRVESDSLSEHSRQTTHLHPTHTYIRKRMYITSNRWLRSNPHQPLTNLECQCLSTLPTNDENPDRVVVLRSFECIKRHDCSMHYRFTILVYRSTLRNSRTENNCFLIRKNRQERIFLKVVRNLLYLRVHVHLPVL